MNIIIAANVSFLTPVRMGSEYVCHNLKIEKVYICGK